MAETLARLLALAAIFAAAWPLARGAARRAAGAHAPEPAAFGVALPTGAYARHVLATSAAGLVLALGVWTLAAPGTALGLLADRAPLARLSGPFLISGLASVLATVWLAGALGAPAAMRAARLGRAGGPAADMALRLALLVPATAAVFLAATALAGAFGGNWRQALGAVPASLGYGLAGAGIWGVFVWAAVLSGLPASLVAASLRAGLGAERAALLAALGLALAAPAAALALALLS